MSGITTTLTATKSIMNRSQRRNDPVEVTAKSVTAATGTETYGETPKYLIDSEMPMNSVTMMRKLSRRIDEIDTVPQRRPIRSRMSRPKPTPVTAPRRTTISWLTMRTGISSGRVQSSV